jgi:hypothetical protein
MGGIDGGQSRAPPWSSGGERFLFLRGAWSRTAGQNLAARD